MRGDAAGRRSACSLVSLGLFRVGRELIWQFVFSHYGFAAALGLLVVGPVVVVLWRGWHRRRISRRGGLEFTPEMVREQLIESGIGQPAFEEDGTLFGRVRFSLLGPTHLPIGRMRADNLRGWDFRIFDTANTEIATVFKSWEGWAHTAFTRADRYTVKVHRRLDDPLRRVTFAAALAVDLALKQDPRGFG